METKDLLILPYLPTRFSGVRVSNKETGAMCTVTSQDMTSFAQHEIERFRASNTYVKSTLASGSTTSSTAKRKHEFVKDLQKTVDEILQNTTAVPHEKTARELAPDTPTDGAATPTGVATQTLKEDTAATPLPQTDKNGNKLKEDEHEYGDELYGSATLKPAIVDDDDDDNEDDNDGDNDDDHDYWDAESANKKPRRHLNSKNPGGRTERQNAAAKRQRGDPPEKPRKANSASTKEAIRVVNAEMRKAGTLFRRGDAQRFRQLARVLPPQGAPAIDLEYIHFSQEITWNVHETLLIEHIYARVPMVVACTDTLKGQVLSEGLKFMRENIELLPSREFENYSVRYLQAFASQVFDAIYKYGLVPVCYEMDPATGQRWPYVPASGEFVIKRYTVRGAIRYRFCWLSRHAYLQAWRKRPLQIRDGKGFRYTGRLDDIGCESQPADVGGIYDPTVEIIHNLGFEVLSTGGLSSKIATLISTAFSRLRSQTARATAESNAALPTLYTEYDHDAEKMQSRNFANGYFTSAAGKQPEGADIRNMTYARDNVMKQAFAGMLNFVETQSGFDSGDRFGVNHEEYRNDIGGVNIVNPRARNVEGTQVPHATQYHVSSARRIVNGPQSRLSADYCAFMEALEDEVCNVLGVPRTYINGTSIKASGDLIMNRFSDEVTRLKKVIGDICTHAYRVLFLDEDVTEYMSSEFRLSRLNALRDSVAAENRSNILLTEEDLYETDSIKRVQVTFAKKPSDSIDELFQLYGLGSVTKLTLASELARRGNFNAQELVVDDNDEEIPIEMRRMLIPAFADYIKMQSQEKMQKQQLQFQERQAKQDREHQMKQQQMADRAAAKQAKEKATANGGGKDD